MARTRTLTNLLTDVADRLDVPAFGASTFVSSTTMTRWLNQSVRRFGQMLIDAYGAEYFVKSASISVVANTTSYALPSDYYQTVYMRVTLDGDTYGIRHADLDHLAIDPVDNYGWGPGCRPAFRVQGGNVVFTPTPKASHTVTHLYVPTLLVASSVGTAQPELSSGTDVLDGYNGWEEWVVLDCCRKHAVAEEKDPTMYMVEMKELEQEIKRAADRRDREPMRARDTYRRGRA
jgi:hypothetical protein